MKTKKAVFRFAALLAVLVLLFSSCGGSSNPEKETEKATTPPKEDRIVEDLADYTIVYPTDAAEIIGTAAYSVKKKLNETYGVTLAVEDDYVKAGGSVPTDTKEILIGKTNRAESIVTRYLDYTVDLQNGRIILCGGSPDATVAAVNWFLENCLKESVAIPGDPYEHHGTYPCENLTVGGIALKEFSVEEADGDCDDYLREQLGKLAGISSGGGHRIILKTDPSLGVDEKSIYMEGKDMILAENGKAAEHDYTVERLVGLVCAATGSEVELPGLEKTDLGVFHTADEQTVAAWRKGSDDHIAAIRATGNMQIPSGATVYYVSNSGNDANDGKSPAKAWKTIDKVNSASIASGSYVCFERGGEWRVGANPSKGSILQAKKGVTYTAYGDESQPKPLILGSPEDGADPSKWVEVKKNIWKYTGFTSTYDVGTLVFDGGKSCAFKVTFLTDTSGKHYNHVNLSKYEYRFESYGDLNRDLDFYHDSKNCGLTKTGTLYLCSTSNPGTRFRSIEFNLGVNGIDVRMDNVTIDNICLKYVGIHGIGAGTVKNLTVKNCEIGWIGGEVSSDTLGRNWQTRLGNGVEIYGGCDGFTVENNYIYQCYDTGITQQVNVGSTTTNIVYQKNMTYRDNVIENCVYGIEYFLSDCPEGNPSRMENFLIEGNEIWNSSYGFCEQRVDKGYGAAIKGRCSANGNRAKNYVIKDNLFIGAKDKILDISSNRFNDDTRQGSMPTFSGNVFATQKDAWFGQVNQCGTYADQVTAKDAYQRFTLAVVEYMQSHSDGTDNYWFMK